jgi:CTP:molybdopterin cytidylyltransferase MocA
MSGQPVAAMTLAAGASEQYGQPKVLLDWLGQPLIAHIAQAVLASPAHQQIG